MKHVVPLFETVVERWAFVDDGRPVFANGRGRVSVTEDGRAVYHLKDRSGDRPPREVEVRSFRRVLYQRTLATGHIVRTIAVEPL